VASVVFTEPAEYDLMDIEYYIYVDLSNHIFYYYHQSTDIVYIIRILYNKVIARYCCNRE